MTSAITYKTSRNISPRAVRGLFGRNRWQDWFTVDDVQWYLKHALHVVSAWKNKRVVGLAVLGGNGRTHIELDTLIVDEPYRGQGIGTALMKRVMLKIEKLTPHHVIVGVTQPRVERFYEQFGFQRNKGTWLLDHKPHWDKLAKRIMKIRQP
ncbi:MAG: GNAT family N-acetyltransferase [Sedimentisphaerales bacterium]|nr:GNAT family N-acetyltransferase [Sedimentisphaerales bacterium]